MEQHRRKSGSHASGAGLLCVLNGELFSGSLYWFALLSERHASVDRGTALGLPLLAANSLEDLTYLPPPPANIVVHSKSWFRSQPRCRRFCDRRTKIDNVIPALNRPIIQRTVSRSYAHGGESRSPRMLCFSLWLPVPSCQQKGRSIAARQRSGLRRKFARPIES
jgi:hypothetical protein